LGNVFGKKIWEKKTSRIALYGNMLKLFLMIEVSKEHIIIVAKGCDACDEIRRKLKGDTRFKILDLSKSRKARKIASKLNITQVPTLLVIDREKGTACTLEDTQVKCARLEG